MFLLYNLYVTCQLHKPIDIHWRQSPFAVNNLQRNFYFWHLALMHTQSRICLFQHHPIFPAFLPNYRQTNSWPQLQQIWLFTMLVSGIRRCGYPWFRSGTIVFVLIKGVSAGGFWAQFLPQRFYPIVDNLYRAEEQAMVVVAVLSYAFIFLQLLTSHFESCSSFADSGSPERPVLCSLLPKSDIDAALLEVCFQHTFEALLLAPS